MDELVIQYFNSLMYTKGQRLGSYSSGLVLINE